MQVTTSVKQHILHVDDEERKTELAQKERIEEARRAKVIRRMSKHAPYVRGMVRARLDLPIETTIETHAEGYTVRAGDVTIRAYFLPRTHPIDFLQPRFMRLRMTTEVPSCTTGCRTVTRHVRNRRELAEALRTPPCKCTHKPPRTFVSHAEA